MVVVPLVVVPPAPFDGVAYTDAQGNYRTEVPAGVWQVRIIAADFFDVPQAQVEVSASTTTSQDFLIGGFGSGSSYIVVTGRITDAVTGQPIFGALVRVPRDPPLLVARTDPNGFYAIREFPGPFPIRASLEGYYGSIEQNVNVAPGGRAIVDFQLPPLPCARP